MPMIDAQLGLETDDYLPWESLPHAYISELGRVTVLWCNIIEKHYEWQQQYQCSTWLLRSLIRSTFK